MSLSVTIETQGSCGIISLSGRMVGSEDITSIMQQVEGKINEGAFKLICDCSQLEYCNSTGLNFFVRLLTKSRNKGGDCVLVQLQPAVAKLFSLSKLNEIFTSYDSVEDAKSGYNTMI